MKSSLLRVLFFVVLGASILTSATSQEGSGEGKVPKKKIGSAEDAKFEFRVALAELEEPTAAWNARFLEELEKLAKEVVDEGDLDKVLLVQEEIATMKGEGERAKESFPRLSRLRTIYDEQLKRLDQEKLIKLIALIRSHISNLATLQKELTQSGAIDEALEVRKELKAMEGIAEDPPRAAAQLRAIGYAVEEVKEKPKEDFDPFAKIMGKPKGDPPAESKPTESTRGTISTRPTGRIRAFGTGRLGAKDLVPVVQIDERDAENVVEVRLDLFRGHWWALKNDGKIISGALLPGYDPPGNLRNVEHLVAGSFPGVLKEDGSLKFWGPIPNSNWMANIELHSVAHVSMGNENLLALHEDGKVSWIGPRAEEQGSYRPDADIFQNADVVASGKDTCFVHRKDGSHLFWSFKSGPIETILPKEEKIVDAAAWSHYLLVLTESGKVLSPRPGDWWWNPPADLGPAKAVRLTNSMAAAQMMDGTWRAWGSDVGGLIPKIEAIGPALDLQILVFASEGWGCMVWIEP